MNPPEVCPNCGAHVPPRALACPECGSDESTGWSDLANHQPIELPANEFDYDEFVQREFGSDEPSACLKPKNLSWLWWIMALLLVLILLRPILQWLGIGL